MATQICTALNKLVYKWCNDGDVYDNTYGLDGWANNLSSYANWIYKYLPLSQEILDRIEDVTKPVIQQVINELMAKGLSNNTVKKNKFLLNQFFDYAMECGLVQVNPTYKKR